MPVPGIDTPPSISDHPAHPGHELKPVANDDCQFFVCGGCMEPGAGTRYRCGYEGCSFALHTCCAAAPETFTHPLFGRRVFLFLVKPPATAMGGKGGGRTCVACDEDMRGFVYHCFDDAADDGGGELDLHPCCVAWLPEHALCDGPVSVLGREASPSRPMDTSQDDKRRGEIRRSAAPPPARHRQWSAPGRQDSRPENIRLNSHAFQHRQETSRQQGDMSEDRSGGRGRREPAAARHRWCRKR